MVESPATELILHNVDIATYDKAHGANSHEPKRPRKLLAHKRQITSLGERCAAKGTTLIPLAMYFVRGMVKLELGVAKGKQAHDKRESIKNREAARDIQRGLTRKTL